MLWLIPSLVITGGILLTGTRARATTPTPGGVIDIDTGKNRPEVSDVATGKVDVRALAASIGAPEPWIDFFDFCFWGESKHNTDVGLGITVGAPPWVDMNKSDSEAKAGCKSYKKNLSWLQPCWQEPGYCFGSGGLGGMFPVSGLAAFMDDPVYRCAHPWSIFDPSAHIIYAAWFARRLQGWPNWQGTVVSMRVGWGNPSGMESAPSADKLERWTNHCTARGLPASFLNAKLPRWKPAPARDLWAELGVDDGWLKTHANMQEAA